MALREENDARGSDAGRGEPGLISTYRMDEDDAALHHETARDRAHDADKQTGESMTEETSLHDAIDKAFSGSGEAEPSAEEEAVMLKSALVICAIFLCITALLLIFGPRFGHG